MGKLGEDEDEDEEPATKRKRYYSDLGLDLGEREEQVVCHASALVLAMIDETLRFSLTVSSTSAEHQISDRA